MYYLVTEAQEYKQLVQDCYTASNTCIPEVVGSSPSVEAV